MLQHTGKDEGRFRERNSDEWSKRTRATKFQKIVTKGILNDKITNMIMSK